MAAAPVKGCATGASSAAAAADASPGGVVAMVSGVAAGCAFACAFVGSTQLSNTEKASSKLLLGCFCVAAFVKAGDSAVSSSFVRLAAGSPASAGDERLTVAELELATLRSTLDTPPLGSVGNAVSDIFCA